MSRTSPFPDEDDFNGSLWWLWEYRIKGAHNSEEEEIHTRYQAWKNQIRNSADSSFNPDEWALDDCWETCRVSNSMYAALVVSIWSGIENFLKSLVSICSETFRKGKEKEPHEFRKIKEALEKFGLLVERCENCITINAVRILNNSYKHDNGRYRPKAEKPHTQIDQALLSKWKILNDQNQNEIDYSKVPIREILVDCNSFCSDLLSKTKAVLASH
jgi:hypothetical protein